jgi:hypothetical protein
MRTPLAFVPSHTLLLLLLKSAVELQAYAPTYTALTDPPYAFAPSETRTLDVKAWHLKQGALLTIALTPLTLVPSHALLLLLLTPEA